MSAPVLFVVIYCFLGSLFECTCVVFCFFCCAGDGSCVVWRGASYVPASPAGGHSGAELTKLTGPETDPITSIRKSCGHVYTSCRDGTVRVYDVANM